MNRLTGLTITMASWAAGLALTGLLAGCPNQPVVPDTQPGPAVLRIRPATLPAEPADRVLKVGQAKDLLKPGMTAAQVRTLLGEPAYGEVDRWVYIVETGQGRATATVRFDKGKVAAVQSVYVAGWQKLADGGLNVPAGSSERDVLASLGEPNLRSDGVWWTCAPADLAPGRFDLFFKGDALCWGSWRLLAKLAGEKVDHQSPPTRKDVRQLLGDPQATEPGAVWDYTAAIGTTGSLVHVEIFFRNGKVASVGSSTAMAMEP